MNEVAQALTPSSLLVWAWRLVVWVSAAYLLALGALVFIRPAVVHRFIDGFVASHRFQRRQAVWAVPFAKRILPLMGISAIALGGLIVWAIT